MQRMVAQTGTMAPSPPPLWDQALAAYAAGEEERQQRAEEERRERVAAALRAFERTCARWLGWDPDALLTQRPDEHTWLEERGAEIRIGPGFDLTMHYAGGVFRPPLTHYSDQPDPYLFVTLPLPWDSEPVKGHFASLAELGEAVARRREQAGRAA